MKVKFSVYEAPSEEKYKKPAYILLYTSNLAVKNEEKDFDGGNNTRKNKCRPPSLC